MRKKHRSDGGYYVAPGIMQISAGITTGHREDKCQWCLAYKIGLEIDPCPDREQLELFHATDQSTTTSLSPDL